MNTRHEIANGVVVHTHACGEDGIFVNAYLIETGKGVVAVDATLTVSTSRAFRRRLDNLNKPLLAVLVTHPHPDHVAGLANLVDTDSTPIYATNAVQALMRRLEAPKREQWTPVFGAEWIQQWRYPNRTVSDAQTLVFDGVRYTVHDLGRGGDSDANSIWVAQPIAPDFHAVAFLSDLIFHGVHSYLADGGVLAWLANLEQAADLCKDCSLAFPGHGAAAAPAVLIAAQRRYLLHYVAQVQRLAAQDRLTDEQRAALVAAMKAHLPDADLEFLIGMGAEAVLAEIRGVAA